MFLGQSWVIGTVEVGDGIVGDAAQGPPDQFRDRLVVVVLLHAGGSGIQNSILAVTENHLTDHGKGQCISSRLTIYKSQNRIGGVTEIRDKPLPQTDPQFIADVDVTG